MRSPLLTVVLPVHNGQPFLRAALDSLLSQTFRDFQVVAIDDGSTDGSSEYLDQIQDERFSVIHQTRAGLGAVLNLGIDLCQTPFLARMDADDISLPLRFEEQMKLLTENPDLVAVGSPLSFLVHDRIQRGLPYPTEHQAIVDDLLRGESSFSHPTLMMRASAARATRYRIAGAGEDLDFCLRLAEQGTITNLATSHYLYRLHEASISMTKQDELERGYSYARLTALERREGRAETSLAAFNDVWSRRGVLHRLKTHIVSLSFGSYRRARLAWAQRLYLQSARHLLISVVCQPLKTVKLLIRRLTWPDAGRGELPPRQDQPAQTRVS